MCLCVSRMPCQTPAQMLQSVMLENKSSILDVPGLVDAASGSSSGRQPHGAAPGGRPLTWRSWWLCLASMTTTFPDHHSARHAFVELDQAGQGYQVKYAHASQYTACVHCQHVSSVHLIKLKHRRRTVAHVAAGRKRAQLGHTVIIRAQLQLLIYCREHWLLRQQATQIDVAGLCIVSHARQPRLDSSRLARQKCATELSLPQCGEARTGHQRNWRGSESTWEGLAGLTGGFHRTSGSGVMPYAWSSRRASSSERCLQHFE